MAFPTRHWRRIAGDLNPGAQVTVAHGLRDGRNGTAITPDAVLHAERIQTSGQSLNLNIHALGPTGWDATNVYLSNWSPTAGEGYCFIVRSYHSVDDQNF